MKYPQDIIDKICYLSRRGVGNREISKQLDVNYGTVCRLTRSIRERYTKEEIDNNADRHKCKTCIYRGSDYKLNGCDFIEHKKRSRGCSVEKCTEHIKGPRLKLKKTLGEL